MRHFSCLFLLCSCLSNVVLGFYHGVPLPSHDEQLRNNLNATDSTGVVFRDRFHLRPKKTISRNSEQICAKYDEQACSSIATSARPQGTSNPATPNLLSRKKLILQGIPKNTNSLLVQDFREVTSAELQNIGTTPAQNSSTNGRKPTLRGIAGGTKSLPKQYPHMALLGYDVDSSEIKWECGGTLISEEFILTAAHCVTSSLGQPSMVRLGELNLTSTNDDATTADYSIVEIIVHPEYNHPLVYNDIAIIHIEAISFTDYIRPICLNTMNDFKTSNVTALGWGATGYGETNSNYLLSVDLHIQPNEHCRTIYTNDTRLPDGFDEETMICAGYAPGGRDSCGGDSGGPLQITNTNSKCSRTFKQVGIISYGMGCAWPDTPAIYTRISYFIPWIESIIWKG